MMQPEELPDNLFLQVDDLNRRLTTLNMISGRTQMLIELEQIHIPSAQLRPRPLSNDMLGDRCQQMDTLPSRYVPSRERWRLVPDGRSILQCPV